MRINTDRFGEVDVDESRIICFYKGIIGFENYHRFVVLDFLENSPFKWLQSLKDPSLAFVVCDPWSFFRDYAPEIPEVEKQELEIDSDTDIMLITIATVPKDISNTTLNLLSPLLINARKMIGNQVILYGSGYQPRHKVFRKIRLDGNKTGTGNRKKVKHL
ncbi:MAG: flagellar assembly protein FliW [Actinobacteria bacterium]|nr:flagellar assembly protein FliW [Actinomycetota bacterium]